MIQLLLSIIVVLVAGYTLLLLVQEHVEWLAMVLLFINAILSLIARCTGLFARWQFCARAVFAFVCCLLVALVDRVIEGIWARRTLKLVAFFRVVSPPRCGCWVCLIVPWFPIAVLVSGTRSKILRC